MAPCGLQIAGSIISPCLQVLPPFDDIAVGMAEKDRPDKAVVDRPAHLSTLCLGLLQHRREGLGLDPAGDVQIQRVLAPEVERRAGLARRRQGRKVINLNRIAFETNCR